MQRTVQFLGCAVLALTVVPFASAQRGAGVKCASAPAAVTSTTGRIDVFVLGNDKQLHQAIYDGKTWRWVNLGDKCYQGVAATRSTAGRIDLFSVDGEGKLIQKTYDRDWSKEWVNLGTPAGGKCISAPSAVLGTTGRLNVFVVAADHNLYTAAHDGTNWKWGNLGGPAKYGATATSHLNTLNLYTVSKDGKLVEKLYDRDWGKEWQDRGMSPGGKCVAAPSAVSSNSGRIDLFVIAADHKVYQRYPQARDDWRWQSLDGDCHYGTCVTSHLNRLDLFSVDKGGNLVQRFYDRDWNKGWVNLGMPGAGK